MRKYASLAVLSLFVVALFAPCAGAAERNFAYLSVAPNTVIIGETEYATGGITSPGGVKAFTVVINGKTVRPRMTVGRLGERNLNGQWIAPLPKGAGRKGVVQVWTSATPKNWGRKGVKRVTVKEGVACINY